MGQFHIAFEMDDAESEIYTIGNHFLGKNVYCDKLQIEHNNGNTINVDHTRLRGIPTPCIKYKARQGQIEVQT